MKTDHRCLVFPSYCLATLLLLNIGCTKKQQDPSPPPGGRPSTSHLIPIDTANRMIRSYLNAINYKVNTNETRSFTLDAAALRQFISNPKMTKVKIFLAHNLGYINTGNEGRRPRANENAITVVVAALDAGNRYVNFENMVLDQVTPCPSECVSYEVVEQ